MKVKKIGSVVLIFVLAMAMVGCYTIKIGGKAELAPSTEEGTKIAQKRCWYALYGLIPIGDNSTDSVIPGTAKKIRVETKYKISDFLINIFTIIVSIETFSLEIYEVK